MFGRKSWKVRLNACSHQWPAPLPSPPPQQHTHCKLVNRSDTLCCMSARSPTIRSSRSGSLAETPSRCLTSLLHHQSPPSPSLPPPLTVATSLSFVRALSLSRCATRMPPLMYLTTAWTAWRTRIHTLASCPPVIRCASLLPKLWPLALSSPALSPIPTAHRTMATQ